MPCAYLLIVVLLLLSKRTEVNAEVEVRLFDEDCPDDSVGSFFKNAEFDSVLRTFVHSEEQHKGARNFLCRLSLDYFFSSEPNTGNIPGTGVVFEYNHLSEPGPTPNKVDISLKISHKDSALVQALSSCVEESPGSGLSISSSPKLCKFFLDSPLFQTTKEGGGGMAAWFKSVHEESIKYAAVNETYWATGTWLEYDMDPRLFKVLPTPGVFLEHSVIRTPTKIQENAPVVLQNYVSMFGQDLDTGLRENLLAVIRELEHFSAGLWLLAVMHSRFDSTEGLPRLRLCIIFRPGFLGDSRKKFLSAHEWMVRFLRHFNWQGSMRQFVKMKKYLPEGGGRFEHTGLTLQVEVLPRPEGNAEKSCSTILGLRVGIEVPYASLESCDALMRGSMRMLLKENIFHPPWWSSMREKVCIEPPDFSHPALNQTEASDKGACCVRKFQINGRALELRASHYKVGLSSEGLITSKAYLGIIPV